MKALRLAGLLLWGLLASTSYSAPMFYISDQPLGLAQPSDMLSFDPLASTAREFGIYAITDERLAGVSLDLLESGGGIKFTGIDIINDDNRWAFLDGPLTIGDSAITSIGGVAIPTLS